MDSFWRNIHLVNYVDEALNAAECAACASTVSAPNANLRAMEVFPEYSLLISARSKNPQEIWGAFCSSWIGMFGQPKRIQTDEAGAWEDEVGTNLCSGRRKKRWVRTPRLSSVEMGASQSGKPMAASQEDFGEADFGEADNRKWPALVADGRFSS